MAAKSWAAKRATRFDFLLLVKTPALAPVTVISVADHRPRALHARPDSMSSDLTKLRSLPQQVARWQQAQQELLTSRHASALAGYRNLVHRFPGVAQLWFELGMAAAGELDFALAEQAFDRAEQLAPGDASMLVLLGQQYHRLRRLDLARGCFERAVAAEPASVHARLSLAAWYERERRLDEAWTCVEPAATHHPRNLQVACVRALLLHRQGRNSEAERVLREVIQAGSQDASIKFSSRHLLGVVLNDQGQYAEAMRWLCEAKNQARQMADTRRMERDYDLADQRRRELLAALTPEMVRRWQSEPSSLGGENCLTFLGGHPRSGTTLLEQVLAAHPDILAFDESEAFANEVWHPLAPMSGASGLNARGLDALPTARRAQLANRYLKSLLREASGVGPASLWLDKNPSPTAALHLWLRLFPRIKVLIALRDPRDVVLSCFFQNLMLTPTNANFLSLERTAKHYADLMDVWLRLRELGGFAWLETRYESIVANLETEGRRVTEFLGLNWHPCQARYHETAREKFVFSPTYTAATQPVHARAVGRWQNYAAALAPIQDRLAPYCRAFGYG
jgi:Flp pilus assembly protein TadD